MLTGMFKGHKFKYDRMFEGYENVFFDENDKIFVCTGHGNIVPLFSSGGKYGKRKGHKSEPLRAWEMLFSELDEDKVALGLKQYNAELIQIKNDIIYLESNDRVIKVGFTKNTKVLRVRLLNAFKYSYERTDCDTKEGNRGVFLVKLGRPTIEDVKRFDNFKQAGEALGITEEQAKDACEKRKQVKDYTIMSAGFRKGDVFYDNGVC